MKKNTEIFSNYLKYNTKIFFSAMLDISIYLPITVYLIGMLKIELTTTNLYALYCMVFFTANIARGHLHREGIGNTMCSMSVINTKTGRPANNFQFFVRSIIYFHLFNQPLIGFLILTIFLFTDFRLIERVTGTSHIRYTQN